MNISVSANRLTYTLRRATVADDLHDICALFRSNKAQTHPSTHTLPRLLSDRTDNAWKEMIAAGMLWICAHPNGEIAATGGTTIVSGRVMLGELAGTFAGANHPNKRLEVQFDFGKMDPVWRFGESPSGFCVELIYAASILQMLVASKDITITALVTQIAANNQFAANKLVALNQCWEEYILEEMCKDWFKERDSADAENKDGVRTFAADSLGAVLKAAHTFLGTDDSPRFRAAPKKPGVLLARDNRLGYDVEIDTKGTGLLELAQNIQDAEPLLCSPDAFRKQATWQQIRRLVFS